MPELPEVETVKKGLENILVNKIIKGINLSGFSLRFPIPKNLVSLASGKKIVSIGRRSKYILFNLSENISLISHLGMSGSYRILSQEESKSYKAKKHDHIIFQFEDFKVVYNDPRRFGYIFITDKDPKDHRSIACLGPEPMSNNFNEAILAKSFYKKERPVKNALLDQTIISGLGNIYVCEALFRSKINPKKKIKQLVYSNGSPKNSLIVLKNKINEVIKESILLGGSSLKDFSNTEGKMGYFQNTFSVYGREGELCVSKDCDQKIVRIVQSGRSTFYCPKCQK
jgi:formamidopyrimidine-DNA glycosylase